MTVEMKNVLIGLKILHPSQNDLVATCYVQNWSNSTLDFCLGQVKQVFFSFFLDNKWRTIVLRKDQSNS